MISSVRCNKYVKSFVRNHLSSVITLVNVTPEVTKSVQPAVASEIGREEQPDERENEIIIELDRENQYGRTQPRANEPQGNHLRYCPSSSRYSYLQYLKSKISLIICNPALTDSPLMVFCSPKRIHFYVCN